MLKRSARRISLTAKVSSMKINANAAYPTGGAGVRGIVRSRAGKRNARNAIPHLKRKVGAMMPKQDCP